MGGTFMNLQATLAESVARFRAAKGLSQTDLALEAGTSRVWIGKIERGEVTPSANTLEGLARALGTTIGQLLTPIPRLERVRFRARKKLNGRDEILATVATWLKNYRELEQILRAGIENPLTDMGPKRASPENTAIAARGRLGLDDDEPIRDPCGLLEDNGIKVFLFSRATDAFFGLCVGSDEGGPAVAINVWDRISVERWIFSAFHELGHLLLHAGSFERDEASEPPNEEHEADRFAGHFLVPSKALEKEWSQAAGLPLLDAVLKVKRMFRVSYKTVLVRLVDEGIADQSVWASFQVQHRRRFGSTLKKVDEPSRLTSMKRSQEPDRLSTSDFQEDRLSRLVRRALEEDEISHGRAGEILGLSPEEMRARVRSWAPR